MEVMMLDLLRDLYESLSFRDPRTKDMAFLNSPSYIVLLLVSYLYVVKVWGPRYMQERKPYDLKKTIMAYNAFQVVANLYFAAMLLYHAFWRLDYSPICQSMSYSDDDKSLRLLNTLYGYLFVRITDLFDTVFFVMKKKFSHISVLHVVHHTIVIFNGWMFLRVGSDGQPVLGVIVNALIHVIMYTYYFLSAFGPGIQKYLWWKRYLTSLQIGQFIWMIFHVCAPLFLKCRVPAMPFVYITLPQVVLILALFVNFYIHSYVNGSGKSGITDSCFVQGATTTTRHSNGIVRKKAT